MRTPLHSTLAIDGDEAVSTLKFTARELGATHSYDIVAKIGSLHTEDHVHNQDTKIPPYKIVFSSAVHVTGERRPEDDGESSKWSVSPLRN